MVVTGGGVLTALGNDWKQNAAGFRAGRCGIQPVTLFDVSGQRARVAAEALAPDEIPGSRLHPKRMARMDRATRLLLAAAHQAWTQSGWPSLTHLPVVLGTTSGGMPLGEAFYRDAIRQPPRHRLRTALAG